ncbi:MAG: cysteine peptidase family C39 domain-containing protein [Caldisericota bacterium]|nr:cysteine peptidase family C39 domain-containing protein [Caldisericota bacterium]
MKHRPLVYVVAGTVVVLLAVFAALYLRPASVSPIASAGGKTARVKPVGGEVFYLQNDPAWADVSLGSSDEKMGAAGCTVACIAMGLSSVDQAVDPRQVVEGLAREGGFTPSGLVVWDAVGTLTSGRVRVELPELSHQVVDAELASGRPVIAKIMLNGLVQHWVLIVGKDGREYLVKDPLDSSMTVRRLSSRSEKIEAIRIFRVD